MKIEKFLESLMESVDGEGNDHWFRDLVICGTLMTFLFGVVIYCIIML